MEMKKLAVTAAEFYKNSGLKSGDVIVFVSSYQSYVAPAIFGANLIGCPVNLLDYDMDTGTLIKPLLSDSREHFHLKTFFCRKF